MKNDLLFVFGSLLGGEIKRIAIKITDLYYDRKKFKRLMES